MTQMARIPPGRAGRMWLRRRLDTAERGRSQLDHKLGILVPEQQRLRLHADICRREWLTACKSASTWQVRAALLGGQDALRHATGPQPAEVVVRWTTTVGVRYPADADLGGPLADSATVASNAAIVPAATAFRAALLAGIRTAAADDAVRRLSAEIAVTRRRLRALDKRWLPWLHQALAALELAIEQAEQEDLMRLRRAAAAQDRRTSP
jgi:V/A-type H+/Na+-transporting ATPase subunit D